MESTDILTNEDLINMRQRMRMATPGPWITKDDMESRKAYSVIADMGINDQDFRIFGPTENSLADPISQARANADFIAHSRNDVRDLLYVVDKLQHDRESENLENVGVSQWKNLNSEAWKQIYQLRKELAEAKENWQAAESQLANLNTSVKDDPEKESLRTALRDILLAYGNVEGLDPTDYEVSLFREFLKGCKILGIKPTHAQILQEST